MDTIFALASAQGRAGVSVIRISGPDAERAASSLITRLPEPRRAAVRKLRRDGEVIDEALVIRFEAGHSFTGEAVVEIHTHGSPAVVSAVLRAIGDSGFASPARAGEFTQQALMNGRLNLTQVEALADLLVSETEVQRRQAQRLLSGALMTRAEGWRDRLLLASALIEATIDFSDEDLPASIREELTREISDLVDDLAQELLRSKSTEQVRDGFEVAIIGEPNVGKSTLLNRLAGREVALTSAYAGTTRDIVEVKLDIGGLAVNFLDTAGLRATEDAIEVLGIERAKERAARADLRLFLVEGRALPEGVRCVEGDLVYRAKADLMPEPGQLPAVSGLNGVGIEALLADVERVLGSRVSSSAVLIRERHRLAVEAALTSLRAAHHDVIADQGIEIAAEELRSALRSLDSLVGRVDVEDILGEIFSAFCIGK